MAEHEKMSMLCLRLCLRLNIKKNLSQHIQLISTGEMGGGLEILGENRLAVYKIFSLILGTSPLHPKLRRCIIQPFFFCFDPRQALGLWAGLEGGVLKQPIP